MSDIVRIFDTTLRDGEQSPGASMTQQQKITIAKMLETLGVDIIEAGFPAASEGDFRAVQAVAQSVTEPVVAGLARATEADIRRAAQAVSSAKRPRIHVFIATSAIHMRNKLRMTPEQVEQRAVEAVQLARTFTDDVEFSPEDAGRSDIAFLCRVLAKVIQAGAGTINIPDTVGYSVPQQMYEQCLTLLENTEGADQATWSAHCHDDLGLAVANSLAAIKAGFRQVECTINGIGERAGNAALEEIVMALKVRKDFYGVQTGINTEHIVPASRLVSSVTGFAVQKNKAIVGSNAFAHESGIHQDGVIKDRQTYEIMDAAQVGWKNECIVLGKHSGRAALMNRLKALGFELEQGQLDELFPRFKQLADQKHQIEDADLLALMANQPLDEADSSQAITLVSTRYGRNGDKVAHADIEINMQGEVRNVHATGTGTIDAVFQAIASAVDFEVELALYSVNAITGGSDAQGEVSVRLSCGDLCVNGQGADVDIVHASAQAYVNALSKMILRQERTHPQLSSAAV